MPLLPRVFDTSQLSLVTSPLAAVMSHTGEVITLVAKQQEQMTFSGYPSSVTLQLAWSKALDRKVPPPFYGDGDTAPILNPTER